MSPNSSSPKTASAKKTSRTKAKANTKQKNNGKPKRPLSAYNLFFQHERDSILRSVDSPYGFNHDANHCTLGTDPSVRRTNKSKKIRPPPHGKIGFAELAKIIGGRWKSLTSDERSRFNVLAEKEKERYNKDLIKWQLRGAVGLFPEHDATSETAALGSSASLPVTPQSSCWPQMYQPIFSPAAAVAPVFVPTQPVYSAAPDQTFSNGNPSYYNSAMPTLLHHEQVAAPRVVSSDFATLQSAKQSRSPSLVNCGFSQHIHMQRASVTTPAAQQPILDMSNANWPILNGAANSTQPLSEPSNGIDADISKMLDLLIDTDAFD